MKGLVEEKQQMVEQFKQFETYLNELNLKNQKMSEDYETRIKNLQDTIQGITNQGITNQGTNQNVNQNQANQNNNNFQSSNSFTQKPMVSDGFAVPNSIFKQESGKHENNFAKPTAISNMLNSTSTSSGAFTDLQGGFLKMSYLV